MVICRTPYRISFFGGGTDYPEWFEEHGGAVISTTINRYCWVTARRLPPFFKHKSRVVWSEIELVQENGDIKHPAVRACLEFLGIDEGVEIHHDGDLPGRSGIGSSSAFTVSLLNALNALQGRIISKDHLAREAIHIERKLLNESVGCQDQVAAAFGGFNRISFEREGSFHLFPLPLDSAARAAFASHFSLFFVGLERIASSVANQQLAAMNSKQPEMQAMVQITERAMEVLRFNDILAFGRLLLESWHVKKSLSPIITNPEIDDCLIAALEAGAVGGKLIGAGGSGFLLVCRPPEKAGAISAALAGKLEVPFETEQFGSSIVHLS